MSKEYFERLKKGYDKMHEHLEKTSKYKIEDIDKFRGNHYYNCVRISSGESLRHALAKTRIAWARIKLGHKIATEVKMKDGREVDIVDFNGEFIEVETNKNTTKKGVTIVRI